LTARVARFPIVYGTSRISALFFHLPDRPGKPVKRETVKWETAIGKNGNRNYMYNKFNNFVIIKNNTMLLSIFT